MTKTKKADPVDTKFPVGARIAWQSQSAGRWVKKDGVVLAILAPEESLYGKLKALRISVPDSKVKAQDSARENARYLVKVDPPAVRRRGTKGMRQPDPVYSRPSSR
jgi:hypothetical protein